MNAHELNALIAPHAGNGRGRRVPVLVQCDGRIRSIKAVEVRVQPDSKRRPRDVLMLIVADAA